MRYIYSFLFTVLMATVISCEDDNKFSMTPSFGFLRSEGTVEQANAEGIAIRFYSNVAITEAVTVQIAINEGDLEYGEDYTTEPAAVDGIITLTLDPEDEQPGFVVMPMETGEEEVKRIEFEIISVEGNGLKLAQFAARKYSLAISGFVEVVPVNLFFDFNGCTADFAMPSGFIEVFEPDSRTDRGWGCRAFGRNTSRAPRASAFVGATATGYDKAWMIMNPIAIGSGADVTLDFWTYSQYAGPGKVSVKWSNTYSGSGNPLDATWNTLTTLDAQFPPANNLDWVNVTGTFTNINGAAVYFAFVFTEGTAASSTAYDIDDLRITVE